MKILRISHLGIASPTLTEAMERLDRIFGLKAEHTEEVADQRVRTAFYPIGESTLEYLESTDPEGPIGKFIAAKGAGMQHIAYRVADIDAALAELKEKGVRLIDEKPRYGAGGARIAFLHPKATGGVLVELCERKA